MEQEKCEHDGEVHVEAALYQYTAFNLETGERTDEESDLSIPEMTGRGYCVKCGAPLPWMSPKVVKALRWAEKKGLILPEDLEEELQGAEEREEIAKEQRRKVASVYVVQPKNEKCKVWLVEHTEGNWAMGGLVVEWRYIDDLVGGMEEEGLEKGKDFRILS